MSQMLQKAMFLRSKKRAVYYGGHRLYSQFEYAIAGYPFSPYSQPVLLYSSKDCAILDLSV